MHCVGFTARLGPRKGRQTVSIHSHSRGGTTQEYNSHKVMEHYLRSMYYDSHTISAVDPAENARCCSGFLNEIFEAAKGG